VQGEQQRDARMSRLGNGALYIKVKHGLCFAALLCYASPFRVSLSCAAIASEAITYEIDVDVFFICWPVCPEVLQKCVPLWFELMNLEITKGEGKAMVDADDCRYVLVQEVRKPHGRAAAAPVLARTGRGKYFDWGLAFSVGDIHPQALQAVGRSPRACIVNPYIATKSRSH